MRKKELLSFRPTFYWVSFQAPSVSRGLWSNLSCPSEKRVRARHDTLSTENFSFLRKLASRSNPKTALRFPSSAYVVPTREVGADRRVVVKITKRLIDAAQAQAKDYVAWDDELPGFGLRVFTSGKRCYVVQCRAGGAQDAGPTELGDDDRTGLFRLSGAAAAMLRPIRRATGIALTPPLLRPQFRSCSRAWIS
jgi:hypothetical protein